MLEQYSWVAAIPEDCHLCTEISKRRTIMQATVSVQVMDAIPLASLILNAKTSPRQRTTK